MGMKPRLRARQPAHTYIDAPDPNPEAPPAFLTVRLSRFELGIIDEAARRMDRSRSSMVRTATIAHARRILANPEGGE